MEFSAIGQVAMVLLPRKLWISYNFKGFVKKIQNFFLLFLNFLKTKLNTFNVQHDLKFIQRDKSEYFIVALKMESFRIILCVFKLPALYG